MTALKSLGPASSSSSQKIPGIAHRCLRRKSRRTYELLDPKKPGEAVSFDVGQIRAIALMDKRLREDGVVTSVPAGFAEFAARFNEYATGPERFATYTFIEDRPVIFKDGSPIVWEHFLIDDSLVGWNAEPLYGPSISAPTAPQNLSSDFVLAESAENPQLQALSAHLKAAAATTDELTKFWIKRGAIEHQYASRLARLAEKPIGQSEPSEFRLAIDGFRMEVARQAMAHNTLATKIAVDLESRCLKLQVNQRVHFREVYEPAARKLQDESSPHSSPSVGISSEWKKEYRNLRHSLDFRLDAMREGRNHHDIHFSRSNYSVDDFDYSPRRPIHPSRTSPSRTKEWEELRDSCEEMEAHRSRFMKDVLSTYGDVLSSIRAADHESYENIIHTFDLFKPKDVVEEFSKNFKGGKNAPGNLDVQPSVHPATGFDDAPTPVSISRPLPDRPAGARTGVAPVSVKVIQSEGPQRALNRLSGPRPYRYTSNSSSLVIYPNGLPQPPPNIRHANVRLPGSLPRTTSTVHRIQRHVRPSLPKLSTDFPRTHLA